MAPPVDSPAYRWYAAGAAMDGTIARAAAELGTEHALVRALETERDGYYRRARILTATRLRS